MSRQLKKIWNISHKLATAIPNIMAKDKSINATLDPLFLFWCHSLYSVMTYIYLQTFEQLLGFWISFTHYLIDEAALYKFICML